MSDGGGDGVGAGDDMAEAERYEAAVLKLQKFLKQRKTQKMWSAFAAAHGLDEADATTMYHGTSERNALLIAKNGFRASCGERQMLGYGVYASTSFWGALRFLTCVDLTC